MTRSRDGDISSPHQLLAQIEADARALDAAGRRLAQAITQLGDVDGEYNRAVEEALINLYHKAKESGERLPAEDIRRALAHRAVPNSVYASYLTAKAQVDALRAWTRATESSLSARQTLLNVLKAELRAA